VYPVESENVSGDNDRGRRLVGCSSYALLSRPAVQVVKAFVNGVEAFIHLTQKAIEAAVHVVGESAHNEESAQQAAQQGRNLAPGNGDG